MFEFVKWKTQKPFATEQLLLVRSFIGTNDQIMTAREYRLTGFTNPWICLSDLEKKEEKIAVEATPRMEQIDALAEFARLDRKADLKYKRKLCEANICRLSELLKENRELLQKLNEEMASL